MRDVEGLAPGAYHYLPMGHQLELIAPMEDREALDRLIGKSLCGQHWAAKASVGILLVLCALPQRVAVRHLRPPDDYGGHGHVGENLYLGCAALGLGTCGIGGL